VPTSDGQPASGVIVIGENPKLDGGLLPMFSAFWEKE
jgi:hypothetical protein